MTIISGLGAAAPVRAGAGRRASAGFAVPVSGAGVAGEVAAPVAMPGLLALQEAGQELGENAVRDREARRHGAALLAVLSDLQRALLGGGDSGALDRLARLVRNAPPPSDPALALAQRAILVRAAVEVARRDATCGSRVTPEKPFATDL